MSKEKGYTLWEVITGKAEREETEKNLPENVLFNPLRLHRGDFVKRELLDSELNLVVMEIQHYTRLVKGEDYPFTVYVLRDGEEVRFLRANPKADCDPHDPEPIQLLWLYKFYETKSNKDIMNAVMCKEFYEYNGDGSIAHTYNPLRDNFAEGYECTVRKAKLGKDNIVNSCLTLWDYDRPADPEMEDEVTGKEVFLFVEIDSDEYIIMYQGQSVCVRGLQILPRK